MTGPGRLVLIARIFWELARYDLTIRFFGFEAVHKRLKQQRPSGNPSAELQPDICRMIESVICFYWHRVRCLQRSVVMVRTLRLYGIPAELVIGCRPAPFFSHAWVEVGRQVVNGPAGFGQKLLILDRI